MDNITVEPPPWKTPRTLRYYEQVGLIKSIRRADYAYRLYSDATRQRINQIVAVRQLGIPLKCIAELCPLPLPDWPAPTSFNKEKRAMCENVNPIEQVSQITDNEVRIIYLPAYSMAVTRNICEEPESASGTQSAEPIRRLNIVGLKPDARVFEFNHPSYGKPYGYEFWVTIPAGLDILANLNAGTRCKNGWRAAGVAHRTP